MIFSHRIRHITNVIVVLLFAVSLQIVYWSLVKGEALQPVVLDPQSVPLAYTASDDASSIKFEDLPGPVRVRTLNMLQTVNRGAIYDRNGHPLADNQKGENGRSFRFYSEPSLAHVVGYISYGLGASGIEYTQNETLLGLQRIDNKLKQLLHQPIEGNDVTLTIDARIQQTAALALHNRSAAGAIVVMDAHTGAILAMVSAPGFDPNVFLRGGTEADICSTSLGCNNQNFFNRATQGLYPPGSTWKTITLIAALETGKVTPETVFDFGEARCDASGCYYGYEVDGQFIEDRNHFAQTLTVRESYALSANTTFARLADEMGDETVITYARRFGFNHEEGRPPIEIEANAPQLANNLEELYSNNLLRASTGIGQGELLASPLSMALVVSAVINDGDIPTPHLLQAIGYPSGDALANEPRRYWIRETMRPETAQQVREMMIEVVNNGTGTQAALPGIIVGGKTGTAEVDGNEQPHAWFTGFAQNEEQTVVIAVMIENGGEGGQIAAPIFAEVAEVAIQHSR